MSPKLKPLLLPQIVENRSYPKNHEHHASLTKSVCEGDLTHVYSSATTNSSSSDIASPLTPTFSARHMRYSSSTSSLELPAHLQETPSSPIYQQQASKPQPQQLQYLSQLPQSAVKPAKRSLPDVEEEPFERAEEHEYAPTSHFGLYSCLCDRPCEHRTSTGSIFPDDFITEGEIDYDAGFMSDSDIGSEARWPSRQRNNSDAPFHGLTTRIGSHFSNNINRWRSTRRPNLISSPTTEVSFETAMPYGHSSRSSSISASANARGRSFDGSAANTPQPTSYFPSPEVMERQSSEGADLTTEERMNLERDRARATTPLLPPLLTKLPTERLQESPLQSPAVVSPTSNTEVQTSPTVSTYVPRPSLSSKPSFSSFRFGGSGTDLPLPLPAMVQDHDEWSDRLGHANFTITPQPYEPEIIAPETLTRFREDWELAKVNYTKHLVRTGENYGQTSNIYALTEAKWAETEDRWRSIHEGLIRQTMVFHSAPVSASNSRSRSRGRARGRSRAGSATFIRGRAAASADVSPDMHHWPRLDAAAPNAITQMLDASDKFPNRGDEDIVGPMVRDEVMLRTHSEERKTSRFWKTLVEKVGIKK